jgi:hypothetical protein
MNTTLIKTFVSLFGSKIIRSALAWLAGYLGASGVTLETDSLFTFAASLMLGLVVIIWSIVAKAKPSDEMKDKLADASHALASFALPAVLGWLRAKGITVTGDMNAEQALLMTMQVTASGLNKPDAHIEAKSGTKLKLPLIIALMACASSLTACTIHPFAIQRGNGGGEYVSLGGSILTKSTEESAEATTASGTRLAYRKTGSDEATAANTFILSGGVKDMTSAFTR